jgi:ornithine decarboxylase
MQRRNTLVIGPPTKNGPVTKGLQLMSNQLAFRGKAPSSADSVQFKKSASSVAWNGTVDELVAELRPALPLYLLRPARLEANAKRIVGAFPGTVAYAVKCNPDKTVLHTLYKSGVKAFDVASLEEIRSAHKIAPKAKLFFMNPIKSREAIREAYFVHGVRAFSLDCVDELYKILQETDLAPDLELYVRLSIPKAHATMFDLTGKFGVTAEEAPALLKACRPVSAKLGICFHVGTQCMNPQRYAQAIKISASVIKHAGVTVDVLDIGGGFPTTYPNMPEMQPAPFEDYMAVINQAIARHRLGKMELVCEPGRAMVADAGSLVVRVEQRKGNMLYLNDGTYGGMFDAGAQGNLIFQTRLIRPGEASLASDQSYTFAGPTCDSIDMMKGPFSLSGDAAEGDWIEVSQLGAYCIGLNTRFNGFGKSNMMILNEK